MPANVVSSAMTSRSNLYAPSYMFLYDLPKTSYVPRKTNRPLKHTLEQDLKTPGGQLVSLEMAWIETWLEGREAEERRKSRKQQEEADAEAAKELNFKEHEDGGGLLEWYPSQTFHT